MMQGRHLAIASILVAAVLWGTTGTIQSLLPEGRDPLAVGAWRLLFGAIALVLLALCRPETRAWPKALPLRAILAAGAAIAGYNLLFFWAVTEAGVGIGTAITIGSAPLWTTGYEVLSQRRLPDRGRLLGQLLSVAGVALLATAGSGGGGASALGIGLAAASGACYAAYSLVSSRIGGALPSTTLAACTFCVAALLTAPVLVLGDHGWLRGTTAWGALAFLGIGATGLAYAFYTWGLRGVAASTAVTLALMEPVTAWLLATFVVAEPLSLAKVAGALMILAGLIVVTLVPAKGRSPRETSASHDTQAGRR